MSEDLVPHRRAVTRAGRVAAALLVLLVAMGGCSVTGSAPEPDATVVEPDVSVVAEATLVPGDPLPAAADPVLTLTGSLTAAGGAPLLLDTALLDRMGVVEATVYEPWVQETLTFQGVWLEDLLDVAGAARDATTLHLTALDDYQIDLSVADARAGGILVAFRDGDGAPLAIEDGGPTRVVFVSGTAAGDSADQWIWSLSTIDVG